jgi:hypothetical protein
MMARTKIPVALRMDPEVKAAAELRSKEDRRSFAGYLEWLVQEDVRKRPLHEAAIPDKARPATQRGCAD